MRKVKIITTAKYLPKKVVTAEELDKKLGLRSGWVEKKAGVTIRHFVEDETSPQMGAIVAREALDKAGLRFKDIDLMISASGTPAQLIPCTASLIQKELGEGKSGVPCFDINSTCLSFLTAMDTISYSICAKKYNRVLIVSSEIASMGLNINHKESYALMGDGAAAVILENCSDNNQSGIISSCMETYGCGTQYAEIRGGGTTLNPNLWDHAVSYDDMRFHMDGRNIFKMASYHIPPLLNRLMDQEKMTIDDFDLVIPHQASKMALRLICKKLKVDPNKFFVYVEDHGNMIAASLPCGIHNAIEQNKIKRGSNVLLLGTSAGLSIGLLIFKY